jgi:dolichol-phosphate mannosyltransferase
VDIPENVGDFRLIDRKVLEAFKRMPERDRFVRGMFGWLGFRQASIEFHREARAAGRTKYGLAKMLRLAMDGIIGFSDKPLRVALWLGSLVSLLALAFGAWVVVLTLLGSDLVPGWASLAVITSFLSGMNLLTVGVVGLYVGRIHNEVKQRPLYVIGREIGGDEDATSIPVRERSS